MTDSSSYSATFEIKPEFCWFDEPRSTTNCTQERQPDDGLLSKMISPFIKALYLTKHQEGTPGEIYRFAILRGLSEFVYFVSAGDLIKIGYSQDPISRFQCLQGSSPVDLQLIATQHGGRDLEQKLHRRFRRSRKHGEWFKFTPAIYWYIFDHTTVLADPQSFKAAK